MLAYFHPAWMVVSLVLAALTLRAGMRLRRMRLTRKPGRGSLLKQHLALAKPTVALIVVGFGAGAGSSLWLREWTPFARLHGWLAALALVLFVAAALLGRRLEHPVPGGGRPAPDRHGLLGLLAVLAAAVAGVAGFVLLP